jgi:hypothetical protein
MRNFEMTVHLEDPPLEGKTDRGRYKVLALITLYLVLAAAFGLARNELHAAPAQAANVSVADQSNGPGGEPSR